MNVEYQSHIADGMKELCDKIMRRYGKTTDEEDANICREGKALIDIAIRSNEEMSNRLLQSLIDKTDELMGRCRWIECRPKGTNTVGVPGAATGIIKHQERVMNAGNRRRQRELNTTNGPNNGHQIKIEFEKRVTRGTDIKAGDNDDNKTVKASNTWDEHAIYAGRDGHYEEQEY